MLPETFQIDDNASEKEFVQALFEQYEQILYNISMGIVHNKHDAEDAVFETFSRIYRKIEKIRKMGCPKMGGYLVIIVKNVSRDILRQRKRFAAESIIPVTEPLEKTFFNQYDVDLLVRALDRLSPQYYEIICMYSDYDMTIEEIAEQLGMSTDTARKKLNRARASLKKQIEKEMNGDERKQPQESP